MLYQLPYTYRGPELFSASAATMPWHITDVALDGMWPYTDGGKNIKAAILDTGVDPDHPDIAGRIEEAVSFVGKQWGRKPDYYDGNDHGTHVATTVARMAPNASFYIGKVLGNNGSGPNSAISKGVVDAADAGCHVINLSLAGPYDDPATRDAIAYAKSKGCLIFAATGNEAASAVSYPARHCVGVGAIGRDRMLAWFSNKGKNVDLVGFGVDILAGVPGGRRQLMSGTSMATPWCVGIAVNRLSAELKHQGAIYTNSDDRILELETLVTDLGPLGKDTSYGRGMPDVERVLKVYQPPEPQPPQEPERIVVTLEGEVSKRAYKVAS